MGVAAVLSFCAPAAHAHTSAATGEARLRAAEAVGLGDSHADTHAVQRRIAARFARQPAARRRALVRASRSAARARHRAVAAQADTATGGSWSNAFPFPSYAIHAVLLPTGKVLFWGYGFSEGGQRPANRGIVGVWDPAKGTATDAFAMGVPTPLPGDARGVAYPTNTALAPPLVDPRGNPSTDPSALPAPVYCSGQSLLPDGRVLMVGGNDRWPAPGTDGWGGTKFAFIFDPWAYERGEYAWTRVAQDMQEGRWYPSQVLLSDGRTMVLGGYKSDGTPSEHGGDNDYLEVYENSLGKGFPPAALQRGELQARRALPAPRPAAEPQGAARGPGPG